MTRRNLFNMGKLWVMSSGGCRHARCTFLISKLPLGVLTPVLGQLDSCCVSHCVPSHDGVDVESFVSSIPLEMRSAELDWFGTCLHIAPADCSWIRVTLFPTDIFRLVNGCCIHVSTIEKSVQKCCDIFTQQVRKKSWFVKRMVVCLLANEVCCCVVECHFHTSNQSVTMILWGEVSLVGLAVPTSAILVLKVEHSSLKSGWCGRSMFLPLLGIH